MGLFVVLIVVLMLIVGEIIVARRIEKTGDKKPSTKSLALFVYNVLVGLPMLLMGIGGLEELSVVEELLAYTSLESSATEMVIIYKSLKYSGIFWLVCGGIYGIIAIMQKLTEVGEIATRANLTRSRGASAMRDQKNNESNGVSSGTKPKDVIPAWQWAEMQKKKEEAETVEVENKVEDKAAEAVAEEKTSKNTFCVYCGDKLDDDQLFCGKCGKKRK